LCQKKQQQQQQANASGNRLRRKYDREFKQEALRMLKNGKGAKEVSWYFRPAEPTGPQQV